ncbi:MAG: SET domain-containing protein-lysine N-methyltransferase [Kiloniellaceae bacterium]
MVRLAQVAGKGRGLLASRAIPAGTCIELAPGVRLGAQDRELVDRTGLFAYSFADPETFGRDGSGGHGCLFAFGQLTFCNHSAQPNAAVIWIEDDVGLWARLEALQPIAENEEITLFYTNISEYSATDLFI